MQTELLIRERLDLSETEFVELVVWRVDPPVRGSTHGHKYRLAFVSQGRCVLRYDNEAGKGDHRHVGEQEFSYKFVSVKRLRRDFWEEVSQWRETKR